MPGIAKERLRQLDPITYLSMEEFRALLKAQREVSKHVLREKGLQLPDEIMNAMDFE